MKSKKVLHISINTMIIKLYMRFHMFLHSPKIVTPQILYRWLPSDIPNHLDQLLVSYNHSLAYIKNYPHQDKSYQ